MVDRQRERDALAISEPICIGDGPTARRNRLGTGRSDGLGAACIPDIEEDKRFSGNMQRPELLGLARLITHSLLLMNWRVRSCHAPSCWAACQCPRNSLLNSSQRSSGKKILAPLSSTPTRVPGMLSATQRAHFTSKYTSSVPQTISVGIFSVFSRAS